MARDALCQLVMLYVLSCLKPGPRDSILRPAFVVYDCRAEQRRAEADISALGECVSVLRQQRIRGMGGRWQK